MIPAFIFSLFATPQNITTGVHSGVKYSSILNANQTNTVYA
jgi:hypothetical protein